MSREWSPYETALLVALRARSEPVPYQQISDDYLPDYTTAAIRGKVSWAIKQHPQLFDKSTRTWRRRAVAAWIRSNRADGLLSGSEVAELLRYSTHLGPCSHVTLTERS